MRTGVFLNNVLKFTVHGHKRRLVRQKYTLEIFVQPIILQLSFSFFFWFSIFVNGDFSTFCAGVFVLLAVSLTGLHH
jgi:hypothetical protein